MTGTHVRTGRNSSVGSDATRDSSTLQWATLRRDRVCQAALAMIVVQLAFRAQITYGTWFFGDDLNFMSRMANEGPGAAFRQYAGHLMPAGMYLSWVADLIAPFDFRVNATMLLGMQVLADVGLLVLLLRLFGSRPGILPPLAIYLFSVISVPVAIWWAAGVNQLPMQVALFWGLSSHVSYLRTGRFRSAVAAAAWVVVGLAFFEKTLLVLGAFAIVGIAWFASGSLADRLRRLLAERTAGVLLYVGIGLVYLALYIPVGLTFSPKRAGNDTLPQVAANVVVHGYLPGIFGGPLRWAHVDQWSLPAPGDPGLLLVLAAVVLLARELARSRRRSLRALWLPAFFLACDVVLVSAGRASFVGALISLDYRYQGELAAVTAVALACATMPIRGATEPVEASAPSSLLDNPRRVSAVVALISVLGVVSSLQYVHHWDTSTQAGPYFKTLFADLDQRDQPAPVVDTIVPTTVMLGWSYPDNLLSHLLRHYQDQIDYPDVATDHLNMVDHQGDIVPAVVPATRRGLPGPQESCGYRVRSRPVTVRLDGPVAFGGWWVRIGYIATGASPVRVTTGDSSYSTAVRPGVHALYVRGAGQFDRVRISGLGEGVSLCTDDVTVGRPVPRTEFSP